VCFIAVHPIVAAHSILSGMFIFERHQHLAIKTQNAPFSIFGGISVSHLAATTAAEIKTIVAKWGYHFLFLSTVNPPFIASPHIVVLIAHYIDLIKFWWQAHLSPSVGVAHFSVFVN